MLISVVIRVWRLMALNKKINSTLVTKICVFFSQFVKILCLKTFFLCKHRISWQRRTRFKWSNEYCCAFWDRFVFFCMRFLHVQRLNWCSCRWKILVKACRSSSIIFSFSCVSLRLHLWTINIVVKFCF